MLKWNKQGPVSAKELARVEAVYGIQGNRNPFIDYPDLANYIWGKDTTAVFPFPEETNPFLVAPRRGSILDFGVILQRDTRNLTLHIQGANLTSSLQLSLAQQNPALVISANTVIASTAIAGTDIGITFSPTSSGLILDTLLITGGGLTEVLRIPVKALATADFITLEPTNVTPVSGTLQWISDPAATNYRLKVYQGDTAAGDLIISTYVEGSSWNKAIELYNGTGKAVDLSKYTLQKQSNGAGAFGNPLKLTGTLDNGKSYVIVHKLAATDLLAKASLVTDSILQVNGNDAIQLVRNGVPIDMVGTANGGADVYWGTDVTLQRLSTVTHPTTVFNTAEWSSLPIDSYAMLGNHSMTLSSSQTVLLNTLTGKVTSYSIQNLNPQNTYTYSVESMRSGVIAAAVNTMQLHTASLDAPLVMEPTDIQKNQFTANWEEVPYASGYLLNVIKVTGRADTTETEGFPTVGSSGTPLPAGWSGTASGNYTSTASSGIATPSISLKNNGEWLQTKTYNDPVSRLTFMYRFASTGTGSSLGLYGLSNGNWTYIDSILYVNTSKYNPIYTFTKSKSMKAFRFIYHKSSGNMAIDDVSATYGSQDTVVVKKDVAVTGNQSVVTGLDANSAYFYSLRASLGSATSGTSEMMGVKTLVSTSTNLPVDNKVNIAIVNGWVKVSGLEGAGYIQLFTISGTCLYNRQNRASNLDIPLHRKGMYILRIQNKAGITTLKFLL